MIQITAIEGNSQKLDGGSMFGNTPRAVWSKWCPPDELGRIKLACRSMVVEIDDDHQKSSIKVLCETGIGCFFEPKLAERYGVQEQEHILLQNLESKLHLKHEDFDYVILSHLHFDHAGGLMPSFHDLENGKTDLLFSNAQYLVGHNAFQRAIKPHVRDKASFIPSLTDKLIQSGRLKIIKSDANIPQALQKYLKFIFTDGHTPGQMHAVFGENGQRNVVFAGDLIPGVAWLHIPITMGYDRFPEQLIDEKSALYETLNAKDLIFFTHDVQIAMACVEQDAQHKVKATSIVTDQECLRVAL